VSSRNVGLTGACNLTIFEIFLLQVFVELRLKLPEGLQMSRAKCVGAFI
jgi:hypothetical protein